MRAAFLKYSFQARIGNMDGIFVAYHNTARIFGFQYLPLEEMDERLYGAVGGEVVGEGNNDIGGGEVRGVGVEGVNIARARGERVFERCVRMMELVCREIAACYPEMVR